MLSGKLKFVPKLLEIYFHFGKNTDIIRIKSIVINANKQDKTK